MNIDKLVAQFLRPLYGPGMMKLHMPMSFSFFGQLSSAKSSSIKFSKIELRRDSRANCLRPLYGPGMMKLHMPMSFSFFGQLSANRSSTIRSMIELNRDSRANTANVNTKKIKSFMAVKESSEVHK